jgi:O-antigen/teichoic acid export membrane protein
MSAVPPIGSTCLGFVIGWLVRFFLYRMKSFTPKALSSIVSIIAGGAAIKLLASDSDLIWWYLIGLFLGFVVYSIVGAIAISKKKRGYDGLLFTKSKPPRR